MNLSDSQRLHGLTTATHTPFHPDGSLNLTAVERQFGHLLACGIRTVFVAGTTGESASLMLDERLQLAGRWLEIARGTAMRVVVHVGSNSLREARTLAAHAQQHGAAAVSALAPSYFKARDVATLVAACAEIADGAPELPFYFYDIPALTGTNYAMPEFLAAAKERIPNLAGIKFTNSDQMAYQLCLRADGGAWDVPWGLDEMLLAALALGARGAVGSSYNFAAVIYQRIIAAFARGDLAAAQAEQFRSVQLIQMLARHGYLGSAKAVMGWLGVPVGPVRLPNSNPPPEELAKLRAELTRTGLVEGL